MINIIHLEDDLIDAQRIQTGIEERYPNCRITLVQTRDEFERTLREAKIDIIISDYKLLMYDGMSALKLAKDLQPDVPFIFVSGTLGEEAAIESLTKGATDYVLKHNLTRLTKAVKRAMQEALNRRERKQARETLQSSNDLLRAIIETVPVAVIGLDLEGNVHSVWNPAAEKMFGWRSQDVMGKPLPTVPVEFQEEFRRLREKIRCGINVDNVEVLRKRRNGTLVHCSIFSSPLYDTQNRINGNIAVLVDITERKRADMELQKYQHHLEELVTERTAELACAKEQAETSNRAKSDFLANMSHELRSPLNAIMGFSQLMARDPELNGYQKDRLKLIHCSGEHLLALINDVLDMTRIEAGKAELNFHDFDFHKLMHELGDLFHSRATAKGLLFLIGSDPRLPRHVNADDGKIRQILINLLDNALKFTSAGKIALRVLVNHEHQIGSQGLFSIDFVVTDTGCGIPENKLETLFHPFVQAKNHNNLVTKGTGLGLAISLTYARLMHGDIKVSSRHGHGSKFTLSIPLRPTDRPLTALSKRSRRVSGLAADQVAPRILVVDDDPDSRSLLMQLLSMVGFEVHEATNGREGIYAFFDSTPDLIIMDVRMPVMNGVTATKIIKSTEKGKHTPVIALTAHAFEEQLREFRIAGCDDCIRKPIDENRLFDSISRYLNVRFTYQQIDDAIDQVQSGSNGISLTTEQIATLPADLRVQLRDAALDLDPDKIESCINQIQQIDELLANMLKLLTADFRFDDILNLFSDV